MIVTNALFQMSPVGMKAAEYIGHGKVRHPGLVTLATWTTALVMLKPLQYLVRQKSKLHQ
jgi:hypothetical protein